MFRNSPLVECKCDETVWQAAIREGYATHRTGHTQYSKPRDGEELVAWVRASKQSAPLPIFAKGASGEGQVVTEESQ